MKRAVSCLVVALVAVSYASTVSAKEIIKAAFDEFGARPRTFRISVRQVDGGYLIPDVLKKTVLAPSGGRYCGTHGLSVGMQDGQFVLYDWYYRDRSRKIIVGDASDLDDIRMLPGVRLTVTYHKNHGPISNLIAPAPNYVAVVPEFDDTFADREFTGDEMNPEAITKAMIDAIDKGDDRNATTLRIVGEARWQGFVWEATKNYCAALPKDHVERIRVSYCEPMLEAAARFTGTKLKKLVDCHAKVLAAGQNYLKKISGEHVNEAAAIRTVLAELEVMGL